MLYANVGELILSMNYLCAPSSGFGTSRRLGALIFILPGAPDLLSLSLAPGRPGPHPAMHSPSRQVTAHNHLDPHFILFLLRDLHKFRLLSACSFPCSCVRRIYYGCARSKEKGIFGLCVPENNSMLTLALRR